MNPQDVISVFPLIIPPRDFAIMAFSAIHTDCKLFLRGNENRIEIVKGNDVFTSDSFEALQELNKIYDLVGTPKENRFKVTRKPK
jgi:hypothetical protein